MFDNMQSDKYVFRNSQTIYSRVEFLKNQTDKTRIN